MREPPRIRRLRTDFRSLEHLRSHSSILDFDFQGDPPSRYTIRMFGKGLWKPDGTDRVQIRELHEVRVELGASYPRMMPELAWKTPIFHPNISGSGVVCLGGYGTHWVPSLNLDELCEMLWDMVRYRNYDTESPYNREAAWWAKSQSEFQLPVDGRSIRDQLSAPVSETASSRPPITSTGASVEAENVVVILDDDEDDIIDAEIVESEDQDILFLD